MKRWIKISLSGCIVLLFLLLVATSWYLIEAGPIGTGYAAKYLCSSVFISHRKPTVVFHSDILPLHLLMRMIHFKVDVDGKTVNADLLGLFESEAIYRKGCGCTLVVKVDEIRLRGQNIGCDKAGDCAPKKRPDVPWPVGNKAPAERLPDGIDAQKLQYAVDHAFLEENHGRRKNTRAIVVAYKGELIAERYKPGFNPQMPMLGWSMSKSVTNALVGILVKMGNLDLNSPAPVSGWRQIDDPRRTITLDQLLRMTSGLDFEEVYAPLYDATNMLYRSYDFARYAAEKPLNAQPDEKWHYSSGAANIIAKIVRQAIEEDFPDYYEFLKKELFCRIGMDSAVIEPDPSGTFVGSSYTFATARDWARFGLLYLQDGLWHGERILPEGWVEYTRTPTPQSPQGKYGALFWLNAGSSLNPSDRRWPKVPRDAYSAEGFLEQKLIIIPSKQLVLVRFGNTENTKYWNTEKFITDVLEALPD